MCGRIKSLVVKEFLQLRRDTWARFRLTVPVLVQMIIFGYAATFEVFNVSTVGTSSKAMGRRNSSGVRQTPEGPLICTAATSAAPQSLSTCSTRTPKGYS